MENHFNYFMENFKTAITKVDERYIKISVYKLPDNTYRERVYCYELYHQLRNLLGDAYEYILDGELDKSGHKIIAKFIGQKIPDFVVHHRGVMENNLVIIEVKPIKSITDNMTNFEKDLEKLSNFIEMAEYQYGIMLVYSNGEDTLNSSITGKFREMMEYYFDKIFLVWHPGPNQEPEIIKFKLTN